jgi:hypothetical protein
MRERRTDELKGAQVKASISSVIANEAIPFVGPGFCKGGCKHTYTRSLQISKQADERTKQTTN